MFNPLHPATIFIQERLGHQFVSAAQITMPPGAQVSFNIVPPSGMVWVMMVRTMGTPRDAATNNPVISPNVLLYSRHSMCRGVIMPVTLESNFMFPWAVEKDLRINDPMTTTIVNGTALTIILDLTIAFIEFSEDNYDKYMRLWNGLYNFELLMGGLQETDVESLVALLKALKPAPLPVAALPKQEVPTYPTMSEDIGKPIKRIEIP